MKKWFLAVITLTILAGGIAVAEEANGTHGTAGATSAYGRATTGKDKQAKLFEFVNACLVQRPADSAATSALSSSDLSSALRSAGGTY